MTTRLKIISINIRGIGSPSKLSQIIQELDHFNSDIFLLQETHVSCKKQADRFESLWNGQCFWSFGVGKSAGVAVQMNSNEFAFSRSHKTLFSFLMGRLLVTVNPNKQH